MKSIKRIFALQKMAHIREQNHNVNVDTYVLPKWQNMLQFSVVKHSCSPDSQAEAAPATGGKHAVTADDGIL